MNRGLHPTLTIEELDDRIDINALTVISDAIWSARVDHGGHQDTIAGWIEHVRENLVKADVAYALYAPDVHGKGRRGMVGVGAVKLTGVLKTPLITVNYVRPDHQGRGAGTQMLMMLEGWVARKNRRYVRLFSSMAARNFYFAHGYETAGVPQAGAGRTWDFPMVKDLV